MEGFKNLTWPDHLLDFKPEKISVQNTKITGVYIPPVLKVPGYSLKFGHCIKWSSNKNYRLPRRQKKKVKQQLAATGGALSYNGRPIYLAQKANN